MVLAFLTEEDYNLKNGELAQQQAESRLDMS